MATRAPKNSVGLALSPMRLPTPAALSNTIRVGAAPTDLTMPSSAKCSQMRLAIWRCLYQLLTSSSSQETMGGRYWSMMLADPHFTGGSGERSGSSRYLHTVSRKTSSVLPISETLRPSCAVV